MYDLLLETPFMGWVYMALGFKVGPLQSTARQAHTVYRKAATVGVMKPSHAMMEW